MERVTGLHLGRYLFTVPIFVFGLFNIASAQVFMHPPQEPIILMYLLGAVLIATSVCMFMGLYDKLASLALAVFWGLYIVIATVPTIAHAEGDTLYLSMMNGFKDLAIVGGALMYSHYAARDSRVVG